MFLFGGSGLRFCRSSRFLLFFARVGSFVLCLSFRLILVLYLSRVRGFSRAGKEQEYGRRLFLSDVRVEIGGEELVKILDRLISRRILGVVFLYDKRRALVRHDDRLARLDIL